MTTANYTGLIKFSTVVKVVSPLMHADTILRADSELFLLVMVVLHSLYYSIYLLVLHVLYMYLRMLIFDCIRSTIWSRFLSRDLEGTT